MKYKPMVEQYIAKNICKNWTEAKPNNGSYDVTLGNTGQSIDDMRQQMYTEVVVALQNYDPNYRTKAGKSVKESTFVFKHLFNRCGQMLMCLTKRHKGYGVWTQNIDMLFEYTDE